MTISIRAATAGDFPRVLNIWRAAVDATHNFLSHPDRAAIEAEVANMIPQAPLTVAVGSGDVAVGFVILDGSHMEALFVDPANRGQGVGLRLVKHALMSNKVLWTDVNEQNAQAIGFYRHLGFDTVGRSDVDAQGRPYPTLHLRIDKEAKLGEPES
jgi:putative acetyltransferase